MSSTHHLALYNFGLHVAPSGDPAIQGFVDREPLNFEAATRSTGFIDRSGYEGEPGSESWGVQVFPRFMEGSGFTSGPSSLSLWQDPETLMAFSYNGVHADALKHARHWNVKQTWPSLVLWWVPVGSRPQWSDGVERLEHLADHGPTPFGFTFKQAFAEDGTSYHLDRARIKQLATGNCARQQDLLERLASMAV
ncbi:MULTISPECIES: DUF3291 domain-containing protein [Rhizobium/Agrobacterium group]|uniref:DUF3291 domain-containing protein n=1 Tax=Rhizobium/Agrobacterium group TaxID=227290 RepID=UPI000B3FAD85|nr:MULTISPECIES: DUF3291 domain-containing protein [Rhizobium/Agrobacterium group]MCF1485486.1 DUF3291 domain-containing protein [Allorhizobium ampelinum]NSZ43985.1 DUF3291 domain-containing protein [Agrobacterium vitis]NTA27733.1 DUF3291 domain-containing protein [Allorhizobium ampelinum]OVE93487.1 hypothetical protein B7W85_14655 [Allorhizobium ampelinum]